MEITNKTSYEDIKKEINDINCKAWYKLITKELSGLKKSLEIEMDYIDEILFCENKMFSENNKDTTIENLEYIIKSKFHINHEFYNLSQRFKFFHFFKNNLNSDKINMTLLKN